MNSLPQTNRDFLIKRQSSNTVTRSSKPLVLSFLAPAICEIPISAKNPICGLSLVETSLTVYSTCYKDEPPDIARAILSVGPRQRYELIGGVR